MARAANSGHIRAGCVPEPATNLPRRCIAGLRRPTNHTDAPPDADTSAPVVFVFVASVGSDELPTRSGRSASVVAVNDLPTVVRNITAWIVGIIATVATLFLTIGGARYLMAGGDPSEVERAKAALKSAGIGYGLALLAPVFMTILRGILGA
jgi:Type IV secretion system pilin